MCGIAGFLDSSRRFSSDALDRQARDAARALAHRGPDDEGVWVDESAGLALAHRRLAILDPGPGGRQPMVSHCGRYRIVYNGEIYNFREIRRELEAVGTAFRTDCDSEVLLAGAVHWGLPKMLQRANGMFALALWDAGERRLTLARDRFGQKPLYYGYLGRTFAFASELKAFHNHPNFVPHVDRHALALFLRFNNVPAPHCILAGLRKLLPGTVLTVGSDGTAAAPEPFWSAAEAALGAREGRNSATEAHEAVEARLAEAVRDCMVSDVPLGAFLSGGLDSSTIVALMQAASPRPVRTFSIGFREADFDESGQAAAVAARLGTDHTTVTVTDRDALDVIPDLPRIYDEPFADLSQIPTYLVSRLARQRVTVSLSGDGGDEIFGGYNRYTAWQRLSPLLAGPGWMRRGAGRVLQAVPLAAWDCAGTIVRPFLPARRQIRQVGDKMHKLGRLVAVAGAHDYYRTACTTWQHADRTVIGAGGVTAAIDAPQSWSSALAPAENMMLNDSIGYLRDDILTKLDRASMAVGLEARVPFLDHRLFEAAWRLPLSARIGRDGGKPILKKILRRHLPPDLVNRPKAGFAVPAGEWLRGPLREWAEGLLARDRLRQEGFLDPDTVAEAWTDHLSARRNRHHEIWCVLMFQSWLDATPKSVR